MHTSNNVWVFKNRPCFKTWNGLRDLRGDGGFEVWKRLVQEHIHIYAWSMDSDNNVGKAGGEGRVEEKRRGEWGISVIVSTIKSQGQEWQDN